MAGENYRRVVPSFWTDPDIKRRMTLEQKALLLYYFTSPHSNMIGLYYCPVAYASSETGLSPDAIRQAIVGVLAPFLTFDPETEEVWVHASAHHQVGELKGGDKRKEGVRRLLEGVHSLRLKRGFLERYASWELGVPLPDARQGPTQGAYEGATQAIAVAGTVAVTEQHFVADATNGHSNGVVKPASKRRPSRDPPGEPSVHWVQEAVEIHAAHIGELEHWKVGKDLKPVVQKHGWEVVKPVWEYFCEFAPVQKYLARVEAGTVREGEQPVRELGYQTSVKAFVEGYTHWAKQVGA